MWSRKRLDIGWGDLLCGAAGCLWPGRRETLQRKVEQVFSNNEDALACLSVRSGFDLLWRVLALPAGSEVLVSAVTIPDMVKILREHGLVPVPLELEPQYLAPTAEMIRAAMTERTRAIVVAHLFGVRIPLEPLIAEAHQQGLLFIEDCAQAFEGEAYPGHPQADVAMFSFGTIKTATAGGGGILRVADVKLLKSMREKQRQYPVQGRGEFLWKLVKIAGLKALSSRMVFGAVIGCCRLCGVDYDRLFNASVKGFPEAELFTRLRRQAGGPMLRLLGRRLRGFDGKRLRERARKGNLLAEMLAGRVDCPTGGVQPNSHWVFPVFSGDPAGTIQRLAAAGFDATQGNSLCAVDPPPGREDQAARRAERLVKRIVFLPFYPEMPEKELRRLAEVLLNDPGCRKNEDEELPTAVSARGLVSSSGLTTEGGA